MRKPQTSESQNQRIIKLLKQKDLNGKEISELVGVSRSHVSVINQRETNGKTGSPGDMHPITGYPNKKKASEGYFK